MAALGLLARARTRCCLSGSGLERQLRTWQARLDAKVQQAQELLAAQRGAGRSSSSTEGTGPEAASGGATQDRAAGGPAGTAAAAGAGGSGSGGGSAASGDGAVPGGAAGGVEPALDAEDDDMTVLVMPLVSLRRLLRH
jgi:hypothetical protein